MKRIDQVLAFLAYSRRVVMQLFNYRTAKFFYLIFRGFTPNKGIYYDFKTHGYNSYVTDYSRYLKTVFINYKFRNLFKDKFVSYFYLKQFTDKVVPIYALIDGGLPFLIKENTTLENLLKSEGKFVIKPRMGRGGEGVVVLEVINGKYHLNGAPVSFPNLFTRFKDHILVPYVTPHDYAVKINPKSLNTIRLLTCVLDDEVLVLRAGHRFGGKNTGFVDNFAQGGISANINVETGEIDDPTALDGKTFKKLKVFTHPDSKEKISGIKIPYWHTVKRDIVKLHDSMKYIKYVGWDIAITPEDYRIIEANYVSDLDGLQMHAPLLTNEISRKFYYQYI